MFDCLVIHTKVESSNAKEYKALRKHKFGLLNCPYCFEMVGGLYISAVNYSLNNALNADIPGNHDS